MPSRLELHSLLCEILSSKNVYFQPPESIKMSYPAIVYSLNDVSVKYANNEPYTIRRSYLLTLIDPNPDSQLVDAIIKLPLCTFDRHFKRDNLNHYCFKIYH